jgi:hypothetical protein
VWDALAVNRLDAVASLTRELAARAGSEIDIFSSVFDALAYHGHLDALMEAMRIAVPGVRASTEILPWGVGTFMNLGADCEIFDYLEHTSSPDPTDPLLLGRMNDLSRSPATTTSPNSSMSA